MAIPKGSSLLRRWSWPARARVLQGSSVVADPAQGGEADPKVVPLDQRRRRLPLLRNIPVAQVMAVPVLAAGLYFFGIARDRYVTRSDFVIRKADDMSVSVGESSGLASLLGRSNQVSLEDARYLKTYLQSPQVLKDLSRSFDLEANYARKSADPWAGIRSGASPEKRLAFFRRQVAVGFDELSGAIVLRTTGLDPTSSFQLNRFMLAKSEQFVNRLNQDISLKQLAFAELELQSSRRRLELAKNRLLAYQDANAVLDAKSEADLAGQTIGKLQEKLVELKVELAALRRQFKDPAEPEVAAVADQVKELQGQIAMERRSAVSRQGRDLNRKAAEMLRLESEVTFANDTYKLALAAVEKGRIESKRQQKFMALLSAPQKPEDPSRDWRTKGFFTVVAAAAVGLSLTKFVLGMQASHRT